MQQLFGVRPNTRKLMGPALLALLVSACGGSGQDTGEIASADFTLSGRAIDGYVARGTVFVDSNENGRRDAWERFAFTDDQGYFSYNPSTGVDYCASSATDEQAQYCLQANRAMENVLLTVSGGYDLQTGEPLTGQLNRRVNVNSSTGNTQVVVTPLTTLLAHASNDEVRRQIAEKLGLVSQDFDVDYLDIDGAGQINADLFAKALQVHKVTMVLSESLTQVYDAVGSEPNTPNDASAFAYRGLAEQFGLLPAGVNPLADNSAVLGALLTAKQQADELYHQRDFDLPYEYLESDMIAERARIVAEITQKMVELQQRNEQQLRQQQAKASAKMAEILASQAVNRDLAYGTFEGTKQFMANNQNEVLKQQLFESLGSERGDIAGLVVRNLSEFESVEQIRQAAALPDDAQPFANVSGKRLRVSDPDPGHAPDDLRDSEVELYFSGEADAVSGPLHACIKFIDGANIDGSLGEGNTRGELVTGFWSLLGATVDNNESYNLLLTLNFLGSRYQAIIKSAGTEKINGVVHRKLRFDNNGDISDWNSRQGLQVAAHVPESNQECEELLPSRIWND